MATPMPVTPGEPVLLTDSVVLNLALVNGDVQSLDSAKMSNTYGCPIAIDEFRFFAIPDPLPVKAATIKFPSQFDWGSILKAKIRIGALDLLPGPQMGGPVHLRSLATLWQSDLSYGSQSQFLNGNAAQALYLSTFLRWRPREPIFISRSGGIDVNIGLDSIANRWLDPSSIYTGVRVYVSAVGRLVPDVAPGLKPYPYAAEASPVISANPDLAGSFAMINDPHFRNPFTNPIRVQKFVASLYANFPMAGGRATPFGTDILYRAGAAVNLKASDSKSQNIAAAPTPMNVFVDPRTGDWNFERELDPSEWFNFEFYAAALGQLPLFASGQPKLFPRVAMVGTHMAEFNP